MVKRNGDGNIRAPIIEKACLDAMEQGYHPDNIRLVDTFNAERRAEAGPCMDWWIDGFC